MKQTASRPTARGLILTLALILGLTLTTLAAAQPATLRVGIGGIPIGADPNVDTTILAQPIYNLIYDTLTAIDYSTGRPVPALAESWELASPTEWLFHIRPGLQFHNGEPINADAVKFSLDRILDPEQRSVRRGRLGNMTGVTVVDDNTISITTDGPSPILPSRLVYAFILPPTYFAEVGQDGFVRAPIGSGPYSVEEWRIGESISLKAYAGNWQGAPPIDTIEFRSIPEPFARVSALEVGEIDVAYSLPPEEVSRLQNAGINVKVQPLGGTQVFHFRQVLEGPTADVHVRQAINYAVDKDAIIQQIMNGVGSSAEGQAVGADGFGYNPDLNPYDYDPERARELLREAGYADGFEVRIATTSGRTLKDKEITEAVAGYMQAVGIRPIIEVQENAVFVERFQAGHGPMFINTLYYAPLMDWDTFAFIFLSGDSRKNSANPEYDRLYQEQAVELDPERRLQILQDVQRLFNEEAFVLFLFRVNEVYGLGDRVQNLEFQPDYSMDIYRAVIGTD